MGRRRLDGASTDEMIVRLGAERTWGCGGNHTMCQSVEVVCIEVVED